MPVAWSYKPPARNAVPLVHAAGEAATRAAAEHLLEASKRLVPVDTGALRDSGRVSVDGLDAAVSYGNADDATGIYSVIQHERLDFAHPHGGEPKFLERPMHAEGAAVAEILATEVRKALRG